MTLRTEYLSYKLTPYPLSTKDGGVLHTIRDASAYMQALSKTRALRAHWQHASRLLLDEARPAVLTAQVQIAVHGREARRWRVQAPEQRSAVATTRHCIMNDGA